MTAPPADTAGTPGQPPSAFAGRHQRGRLTALLADPRVRLGVGTAGLLATAMLVRADHVGRREVRIFRAVNNLPDELYIPAWTIMQLGTLGSAPAAAAVAWAAGDRRLAWRLAASGSVTWALAKLVKREVRRPRPASLLADARCRGREASGLGYLSGHAGVATALGVAAFRRCRPGGRAAIVAVVPTVGMSRAYVGAHLPLDIAGGAALGIAVEAAVALAQRAARPAGGRQPGVLPPAPDASAEPDNGAGTPAVLGQGREAG